MTHSKSRQLAGKCGVEGWLYRENGLVGRKSRRAQRLAIYQRRFAPDLSCGVRPESTYDRRKPSVSVVAGSGVKPSPRRGSKPARSNLIEQRNLGRAEFFALPTLGFAAPTFL